MAQKATEAISIAYVTQDGKFHLNMNNLNLLLDKLADKEDIAIISMAGKFRTGKSFMLSIFLRFLRKKGWENTDWFGPEHKKLNDGFKWEKGTRRHTEGVNVWPEIFDVPLPSGKQISVIIVDTQGLYDKQTRKDTNAKLLVLSTLLSSHQILNTKDDIDMRDLEFLQLSMEYSRAITEKFQQKMEHPFQTITFLIRDWCNSDEFCYGSEGGTKYVNRDLEDTSADLEEVQKVKKAIPDAYKNVHGFLMPLPGKGVRELNYLDLKNADITDDFLEYTHVLTNIILLPENLIVKDICGKPMSTNSFLSMIAETSKILEKDGLPTVETLLEGVEKSNKIDALIEAVKMYNYKMKERIGDSILPEIDLYEHNMDSLQEARKTFDDKVIIGSEDGKSKTWKKVVDDCKNEYDRIIEDNKAKELKKIQEIDEVLDEQIEKYEDKMNELDISSITDDTLEEKQSKYLSQSVKAYESKTKAWNDILSNVITAKRARLIERARVCFENLKKQKIMEEHNKMLQEREEQLKIKNIVQETAEDFEKELATKQKITTAKKGIDEVFEEEIEKYEDKMKELDIKLIASSTLEEKHFEYLNRAVEAYKSKTKAWNDILLNVITAKQARLRDRAIGCFENLKKKKIMKEQNKMLQEWEEQLKIENIVPKTAEDIEKKLATKQKISTAKQKIDGVFEEEIEKYEDKMNELDITPIACNTLGEKYLEYLSQAVKAYKSKTKAWNVILSNIITAKQAKLIERARLCFENLKKKKINEEHNKMLQEDLKNYEQDIKEMFEQQKLERLHDYDRKCEGFENKQEVKKCRKELTNKLNESYQLAKIDMVKKQQEIATAKKEIDEVFVEEIEKYEDKMNELDISSITGDTMEEKYFKYLSRAVETFESKTKTWNDILSNVITAKLAQLNIRAHLCFENLKKKKIMEEDKKILKERKEKLKIESIVHETADDFEKWLAPDLRRYKPNIKEIFERQKKLRLDYYDEKCEAFENTDKVEECRKELIKKFNESYQLAKIDMEEKKEAISEKYKENVKIVSERFRKEMEQLLQEGPLSNKEFAKKYGEIKCDALDRFSTLNKNIKTPLLDSDVEKFKRKLIETVQRKYIDEYKKTNEFNQEQLERDLAACEKHVKSTLDLYTKEMDKIFLNGKHYKESDLREKHNSYETMAIEEFMKLSANIASWTNFIDELRKQIQEKLPHYQSRNCESREIIQKQKAAQQQIIEIAVELKDQYMRLMGELDISSISDRTLNEKHSKYLGEAVEDFERKTKEWKVILSNPISAREFELRKTIQDHFENLKHQAIAKRLAKEKTKCDEYVRSAIDNYTMEMDEILSNDKYLAKSDLEAKHLICIANAIDKFKILSENLQRPHQLGKDFADEVEEKIQYKLLHYQSLNSKNHEIAKFNEKQAAINDAVKNYSQSMEQFIANKIIEDETLEQKHNEYKKHALETNHITDDDKEKVKTALIEIYLKIKINNTDARNRENMQKLQKEFDLQKVQTKKDHCVREFMKKIKKHSKAYVENFQCVCDDIAKRCHDMYDKAVQQLRNVETEIKQAKQELKAEIEEKIEATRKINMENQIREYNRIENIVNDWKSYYRTTLDNLMEKHFLKSEHLDDTEKEFINKVERDLCDEKAKEKMISMLKRETLEAKRRNAKNKKFRVFTSDDASIQDFLHRMENIAKFYIIPYLRGPNRSSIQKIC